MASRIEKTETEKAYYAGYVDGEGCITLSKNKGSNKWHTTPIFYYLEVMVANTHPETLFDLKRDFGGSIYGDRRRSPNKTVYRWRIICSKALIFLETILPYLRQKRKQAELMIEYQKKIGAKEFWKGQGIKLTIEESRRREDLYKQMRELNRRGI